MNFRLKSLFRAEPKPKRWDMRQEAYPWFDQPDALDRLERMRLESKLSESDVLAARQWINDGYCTISGLVADDDIEAMKHDLQSLWTTTQPVPGAAILGAQLAPSDPVSIPHHELIAMYSERKKQLRDETPWRVHNFHQISKSAGRIHANAELKRIVTLLFGIEAIPRATINFMYGSRQSLHQDMTVFFIHPRNFLIGAWLACEDISPESGPLVYYPGSHREKMFSRFDNYPQTSLKTCSPEVKAAYENYLQETARKYERHQFLGKKGDILLWHGMLIHGGDAVLNPRATRQSYVCHYIPEGMQRDSEIVGPFNW